MSGIFPITLSNGEAGPFYPQRCVVFSNAGLLKG